MARRPHVPVPVEEGPDETPRAFAYKGVTYRVRVVSTWHLRDRWWDPKERSDRLYFRVVTSEHEVFELYRDIAGRPPFWVLDVIQD